MDVQLLVAEAIREPPVGELDELCAQHLGVEAVRALPVGDGKHTVIESESFHRAIMPRQSAELFHDMRVEYRV